MHKFSQNVIHLLSFIQRILVRAPISLWLKRISRKTESHINTKSYQAKSTSILALISDSVLMKIRTLEVPSYSPSETSKSSQER
jgi:hypothetical protein